VKLKGGENMILTISVRVVMFCITIVAKLTISFDR